MKTILYIHGMGGGEDSRIPSILNERFGTHRPDIRVVVRTYDFHPGRAAVQIKAWYEELKPDLVIGESLGGVHALALGKTPLLLVSPALNAPDFLYALRGIARIPLMHRFLNHIYKPREGRRQELDFVPETLSAWGTYRLPRKSLKQGHPAQTPAPVYAFFGRRDHYRRWGVVSVKKWRRTFGPGTYALYDGTHFMEETYLQGLLIPAILERI